VLDVLVGGGADCDRDGQGQGAAFHCFYEALFPMLQQVRDRVHVCSVQVGFGADLFSGVASSFECADFFEEFGRRVSSTGDVFDEAHEIPVFFRRGDDDCRDGRCAERLVSFESSLAANEVVFAVGSWSDGDGAFEAEVANVCNDSVE